MAAYQDILGQHYRQVLPEFPQFKRLAFDDESTASEQDY